MGVLVDRFPTHIKNVIALESGQNIFEKGSHEHGRIKASLPSVCLEAALQVSDDCAETLESSNSRVKTPEMR
jgi:hypothetical protein